MTVLLLAASYALLRALQHGARAWWLACGALLGVATLTAAVLSSLRFR
jgi:4-amino-4-deoxy-L-arabinose transferase-like glycosyltransferase